MFVLVGRGCFGKYFSSFLSSISALLLSTIKLSLIMFIVHIITSSSCDHFVSERSRGDWYSGEHIDNPGPLYKGQHGDNLDDDNDNIFWSCPQDALESRV